MVFLTRFPIRFSCWEVEARYFGLRTFICEIVPYGLAYLNQWNFKSGLYLVYSPYLAILGTFLTNVL
jgi:hypothetical protein